MIEEFVIVPIPEPIRKRRGTFTLAQLMLYVAGFAAFSWVMSLPLTNTHQREAERRIRNWQPTKQDSQRPDERLMFRDTEISGMWQCKLSRYKGSRLSVEGEPSGTFRVHFSSGGCLGHFEAERTGHFENGVLVLNQPVAEYCGGIYHILFVVAVCGDEYLVPSIYVDKFQAALSADLASVSDDLTVKMHSYRRVTDGP